ncbi:M15 family metallopeptidase [Francisella adeliensis]|uniref:M15 family metallopeptidase n=1 Tax=Francisella adeliensis TaxID=2007306 RepID=A0A2Z4XW41_9GAMM|nr:M15 family metallopeptidase [Francisella adeliensis]AXA32936.1 hypothetical protein CDH04_00200 [Francisella adeliensis]MBK2086435.1 M15 family metallopeptidase [Francisella adeliensis]MBK2096651.1 M15 family metallopeptidase [Francisella adeliensis]QIW11161.1 M15 family metallopeptidase [Francisella adeliensis]QIW13038.1 M15 family metallopeptidase [Francisella adeliensis]
MPSINFNSLDKKLHERPHFKQASDKDLFYWGKDVLSRDQYIHKNAFKPLKQMIADAKSEGVILEVLSIYRSYEYQEALISRHLDTGKTLEQIVKKVAIPGYSEHHTGLAIDFTTPDEDGLVTEAFEQTSAFVWLHKNANDYGFYMSYPRDNLQGMIYEPWHWCLKQYI